MARVRGRSGRSPAPRARPGHRAAGPGAVGRASMRPTAHRRSAGVAAGPRRHPLGRRNTLDARAPGDHPLHTDDAGAEIGRPPVIPVPVPIHRRAGTGIKTEPEREGRMERLPPPRRSAVGELLQRLRSPTGQDQIPDLLQPAGQIGCAQAATAVRNTMKWWVTTTVSSYGSPKTRAPCRPLPVRYASGQRGRRSGA